MGKEIERKFLVTSQAWKKGAKGRSYRQGYLLRDPSRTIRVRVAGEKAFLTIKGKGKVSRAEYEYEIPVADAGDLLELCDRPLIEKVRYEVEHKGHTWEIDEFSGDNQGLIVAELELGSEGEKFERPAWLGSEVTDDSRYVNANLVEYPYSRWTKA